MTRVAVREITCTVPHSLSPRVRTVAEECGIIIGLVQASRNVQIRERALPFLSTGISTWRKRAAIRSICLSLPSGKRW